MVEEGIEGWEKKKNTVVHGYCLNEDWSGGEEK